MIKKNKHWNCCCSLSNSIKTDLWYHSCLRSLATRLAPKKQRIVSPHSRSHLNFIFLSSPAYLSLRSWCSDWRTRCPCWSVTSSWRSQPGSFAVKCWACWTAMTWTRCWRRNQRLAEEDQPYGPVWSVLDWPMTRSVAYENRVGFWQCQKSEILSQNISLSIIWFNFTQKCFDVIPILQMVYRQAKYTVLFEEAVIAKCNVFK